MDAVAHETFHVPLLVVHPVIRLPHVVWPVAPAEFNPRSEDEPSATSTLSSVML